MRIYYPGKAPAGLMPSGDPWPEFRMEQLEAIARITREITEPDRSGSVLVGASMGSGKTVVLVEVLMKVKPKRTLIVGVRDAYGQWAKALREQGSKQKLHRIDSTDDGEEVLKGLLDGDDGLYYIGLEMLRAKDWGTVTKTWAHDKRSVAMYPAGTFDETSGEYDVPDQLHTFKHMPPVDVLISDESHRHSNQKTASLKTVQEIPTHAKIALSGTFFGNRFENAWSLATWLWSKKVIGTKGRFLETYCVVEPIMSKDGRRQLKTPGGFPLTKVTREKNPGEYVETLPCYVFMPSPLGEVPEPEIVKVSIGKEQRRQYREMERQSLTWIPSSISTVRAPLVADLPAHQKQRLRTAALGAMTLIPSSGMFRGRPKGDTITFAPDCISTTLNAAYEVLHRPTWIGKKALILTHSKPFAEEAARRIGKKYRVALKTGSVTSKKWETDKASFMSNDPDSIQYCIAVISAVGTATDGLQANCAKVLWLSEDDNNINNIQGANRIYRPGVNLEEYESVKLVQTGTVAEGVLVKNNEHRTGVLDSVMGTK